MYFGKGLKLVEALEGCFLFLFLKTQAFWWNQHCFLRPPNSWTYVELRLVAPRDKGKHKNSFLIIVPCPQTQLLRVGWCQLPFPNLQPFLVPPADVPGSATAAAVSGKPCIWLLFSSFPFCLCLLSRGDVAFINPPLLSLGLHCFHLLFNCLRPFTYLHSAGLSVTYLAPIRQLGFVQLFLQAWWRPSELCGFCFSLWRFF